MKDTSRNGYVHPAQKSRMKQLTITLPETMLARIDEMGQETGIRRSAVIQAAMADYLRVKDLQAKTVTSLLYALPSLLPEAAEVLREETVIEDFDGEGGYFYEYKPISR